MAGDISDKELNELFKENVRKLPRVEKLPIDPPVAGQNYALVSFKMLEKPVNGVYGLYKVRGVFPTEDDWVKHAKNLIRTVDSKHKIWPFPVGAWAPITNNEEFAKEVLDVQQQDDVRAAYSQNESEEQKREKQRIQEIKEREKKLKEEASNKDVETDTLDYYAQQIMKMEQLESWLETVRKRRRELLASLKLTQEKIVKLDGEHPEYKEQVGAKIDAIKKEIGLEGATMLPPGTPSGIVG